MRLVLQSVYPEAGLSSGGDCTLLPSIPSEQDLRGLLPVRTLRSKFSKLLLTERRRMQLYELRICFTASSVAEDGPEFTSLQSWNQYACDRDLSFSMLFAFPFL